MHDQNKVKGRGLSKGYQTGWRKKGSHNLKKKKDGSRKMQKGNMQ
jgi:hypothetical protein